MAKETNTQDQQRRLYKGQVVPDWMPDSLFEPEKPSKDLQIALLQLSTRVLREGVRRLKILVVRATTIIPAGRYNGIDAKDLDRRMRQINWNKDYYSPEALAKSKNSPRLQRRIMRANSIFRDLKSLSDSGHYMAEELRWKLQHKYWRNTRMEPQTGNTLEQIIAPANHQSLGKTAAPGDTRNKGIQTTRVPARDQSNGPSQKRQQNEARRKKIAMAGASLVTSLVRKEHKRKRGLGI